VIKKINGTSMMSYAADMLDSCPVRNPESLAVFATA